MAAMPLPLWIPLAVTALFLLGWVLVVRHLHALETLPEPVELAVWPRVTLCMPARNEAREVGRALDSWLRQDLPGFRIVVVDDGSTDATPQLLEVRRAGHPERLAVLRCEVLPPGWLGKNHALHLASEHPWAREADWILFVDADVRAEPDLLRRVLGYLETHPTDVLALMPGLDTETLAERLFVPAGSALVVMAVSPTAVANPRRFSACGIGAFTLIRQGPYRRIGGRRGAPLEPVDDMALAFRAKRAGAQNRVAAGGPALRLRMYHGAGDILRGMRKNILGLRGALGLAPAMLVVLPALTLSPLWLARGGWPEAGLLVWLMFPAMVGGVHQRLSAGPSDLVWAFWPLLGPWMALGVLQAMGDRLRGRNVWRGRSVRLEPR